MQAYLDLDLNIAWVSGGVGRESWKHILCFVSERCGFYDKTVAFGNDVLLIRKREDAPSHADVFCKDVSST